MKPHHRLKKGGGGRGDAIITEAVNLFKAHRMHVWNDPNEIPAGYILMYEDSKLKFLKKPKI
jgi:hypothetical protein